MNVVVNEVLIVRGEFSISFLTSVGSGIGSWNGIAPAVKGKYYVELDVVEPIVWGDTGNFSLFNRYYIGMDNGFVKLTGRIVYIDMDGFAVFDLDGSVVLLEISGFTGSIPVFVDLCVKKIVLYPTGS